MTQPFKHRLLVCMFVLKMYLLPNIIFIIKPCVISMNRAFAFTVCSMVIITKVHYLFIYFGQHSDAVVSAVRLH